MNIEKPMVIGVICIVGILFCFEFLLIKNNREQDKAELTLLIRELDIKHRKYEVELERELKKELMSSILVRSNIVSGGIK